MKKSLVSLVLISIFISCTKKVERNGEIMLLDGNHLPVNVKFDNLAKDIDNTDFSTVVSMVTAFKMHECDAKFRPLFVSVYEDTANYIVKMMYECGKDTLVNDTKIEKKIL